MADRPSPVANASPDQSRYAAKHVPLLEIARTFLVFGVLGFGGPAAHIGLMERELVARRGWLSREHFLDLLAAINLVPGPNSTEMAFYIGYITNGFWGAVVSGLGFIVPAVVFSIALAMIYTTADSVPAIRGLFIGLGPVVLTLILGAAYRLGRKAIDSPLMLALLLLALLAVAIGGIPELAILLTVGILYVLVRRPDPVVLFIPIIGTTYHLLLDAVPSVVELFWRFFVIGATLFGSGYVLAAYLQRSFVDALHWLTPQQLLDVLAIGQVTPGPLSSTVSAAGYIITVQPGNLWSGVPGAIAATIGVFLPAFVIVLILGRVVPLLRRYPIALDFLKGVNAGVIALLTGAFVNLAISTLIRPGGRVDWLSLVLTGLAFILLERFKWSPLLLVIVGAASGLIRIALGAI